MPHAVPLPHRVDPPAPGSRWTAALTRRRGSRTDDLLLRVTGALAASAVIGALLVPAIAQLAPFVLYTIWTNGPHSPVLNGGYEPVLMLYGRFFPPLLIGALGTAATVFVEWINYHLYARARHTRMAQRLSGKRWVMRLTDWYRRHPFAVIVFCALGPVPFWMARILSVLSGYSIPRHLTATALGRFPRLWVIAALGQPLGIPASWLVGMTISSLVLGVATWGLTRWRGRRRAPAAHDPGTEPSTPHFPSPTLATGGLVTGTPQGA